MNQEVIVLASGSPRRRQLLEQIGIPYQCHPVSIDETRLDAESPLDFARRLALAKATEAWSGLAGARGRLVLGADTAVSRNGCIFGKPADVADAVEMLSRLSGGTHEVTTAVAAVREGERMLRCSVSRVIFRPLGRDEIDAYVATGEPQGKAGSYAIQGRAAVFVQRLEGSYSGVMGLPLFETWELLRALGHDLQATFAPRQSA